MTDWRDDLKAVFCMRGFHQEVGVEEDEVLEFLEEQGLTGEFVDGTQWIIPVSYTHLTLPTNREV